MTAASALIAGNEPQPELAAEAVEQALARAGLTHANGILLFLTPDFARHAGAAVHAAARAGHCLQVTGGIAAGVANERSWIFDRPAAAALVLGDRHGLAGVDCDGNDAVCIAAESTLPQAWRGTAGLSGLLYQDPLIANPFPAWQGGRLSSEHRASASVPGTRRTVAVATGLRAIGPDRRITAADGFELAAIDGLSAADALYRALPAGYRRDDEDHGTAHALPLHHLCAMIGDDREALPQLLPIVAANADGSLTLGDRVAVGQALRFAVRQPVDAESELNERLGELAIRCPKPDFGLYFSCIGRGPYFYSGEDRDWALLRERFPGMPFVGTYGHGQIAPVPESRVLQNCFVINLFSDGGDPRCGARPRETP